MQSFHQWTEHRIDDPIPDATTVALMVARTGPEGMTSDELRRKTGLAFDVLERMLAKLTATGQLFLSRTDGRTAYQAGIMVSPKIYSALYFVRETIF